MQIKNSTSCLKVYGGTKHKYRLCDKKKLYFTGTINDLNIELVTLITTYPYNWYLNENLVTKLLQR